jgi:uncharacterized protein with FMN-binding domain
VTDTELGGQDMKHARLIATTLAAGTVTAAAVAAAAGTADAAAQTTGAVVASSPPLTSAAGTASAAGRWLLGSAISPRSSLGAVARVPGRDGASSPKLRSATGEEVNYRYGLIAVRAFVSGTKLVKITIPVLQVDAQLSQRLAQYSLPVLERESVHAQSAKVATVSGATWTSEGFEMSLQSTLTKLRVR